MLVFGVGTYAVGMGLKGTDVIVDQLAIVRAAAGTDRGLAQAYVGIFSPNRQTYDVAVGDDALLANPIYLHRAATAARPSMSSAASSSRLRGYEVGFGVLRAFRAEAPVRTPRVDADLTYRDGVLEGTLTNRSDEALESVAVTWGGQATLIPTLAPGATADVRLDIGGRDARTDRLADDGHPGQRIGRHDRPRATRRARPGDRLSQHAGHGRAPGQPGGHRLPTRPHPGRGDRVAARQEGDTLYLMPAAVALDGKVILTDPLIARSTLEVRANEVWDEGGSWSLGSGWLSAELRPVVPLDGATPSYLGLTVSQEPGRPLHGSGPRCRALARRPTTCPGRSRWSCPRPRGARSHLPMPRLAVQPASALQLPAFQLLDRTTGQWVEFPQPTNNREMRIVSPERYLDEAGALRLRFVNRVPNSGT